MTATTGKAWTDEEQRAVIRAYNAMLHAQRNGIPYNKAGVNRLLRGDPKTTAADAAMCRAIGIPPLTAAPAPLAARSRGSVEAKMMNISAARLVLGMPLLQGYKPAGNFQRSLTALIISTAHE